MRKTGLEDFVDSFSSPKDLGSSKNQLYTRSIAKIWCNREASTCKLFLFNQAMILNFSLKLFSLFLYLSDIIRNTLISHNDALNNHPNIVFLFLFG
jgi:hypothetical protein